MKHVCVITGGGSGMGLVAAKALLGKSLYGNDKGIYGTMTL